MQNENINTHIHCIYLLSLCMFLDLTIHGFEFLFIDKSLLKYSLLKVDEDFSDVGDLTSDTASADDDSRVLKKINIKSLNFIKILTVIKINN